MATELAPAVEIILRKLANTLPRYRYSCSSEKDLHKGIALVLDECFLPYEAEYIASPEDRFDFFVARRVVIEAKIDGSLSEAARQVHRYAALPEVEGIVIVTTKPWGAGAFVKSVGSINAKRLEIVHVMRRAF